MADGISRPFWRATLLRGGLRRRILAWFLVLSLIPLLVSNTVGYLVTRHMMGERIHRYLDALTEVEAEHVANELERHQLYLDAIVAGNRYLARNLQAASRAVAAGAREAEPVVGLHEHLDRKLAELEPLSELFVIDTAGRVIASTRHERLGTTLSDSDVLRFARFGRFFEVGREMNHGTAEPVYRLASPIHDEAGGWLGVLVGTVGFERAKTFLHIPPHLAGEVHVYIVDRRGHPLFVSHAHAPINYALPLPSPLARSPGGSFARYVNYEGEEVIGTSVDIPGLPWRYISEVSVSSAFGQLRSLALLAAALEAIFALALVGIVWVVARSIVAPLRQLVSAAERIRGGELGVEVQIDRDDELGDLGRTFSQMSTELDASSRRIRELHDQEMRRAAQLASVGEMASGIAHEVKNPLAGAVTGLDLLTRKLKGDSNAREILGQVRIQLGRIESALRDLLSYARPKEPRLGRTDPRSLVERVVSLVRAQADAAGIRIEKELPEAVPRIRVDPEQMAQALVNLALNGIQAMKEGGVLRIRVESGGGEVRLIVEDEGVGIPDDQMEAIFRPFHTTKHHGTGLGLAITRGIVERHGGRLAVSSRPGQGSRFTLVFGVDEKELVPL